MRAERFGSYSISFTVATTPKRSRRKSIRRYIRLCPPPRRRIAMCPWLSRPPDFLIGSSRDFSGVVRVISEKSEIERNRVPLVTGLNCRMPMVGSALESVAFDRVALAERHDGLLPVRAGSRLGAPYPARLAARVHRVDCGHLHAKQPFDGLANRRLGGVGRDLEHVFTARLVRRRGALGDDRADDGAMQCGHGLLPLLLWGGLLRRSRLLRRFLCGGGRLGRRFLRSTPGGRLGLGLRSSLLCRLFGGFRLRRLLARDRRAFLLRYRR